MRSRTATALAGLVASLAVSVAAWYYFDTLLVFLFLPFVPFLFRRRTGPTGSDRDRTPANSPPVKECPRCGFRTRDEEYTYCPRDGARLVPDES